MVEQLPTRDPVKICRWLGVSRRTWQRWCKTNAPPLIVYRALYWETPIGWAHMHEQEWRELVNLRGLVKSTEAYARDLRTRITRLEGELSAANSGAANLPYFRTP